MIPDGITVALCYMAPRDSVFLLQTCKACRTDWRFAAILHSCRYDSVLQQLRCVTFPLKAWLSSYHTYSVTAVNVLCLRSAEPDVLLAKTVLLRDGRATPVIIVRGSAMHFMPAVPKPCMSVNVMYSNNMITTPMARRRCCPELARDNI